MSCVACGRRGGTSANGLCAECDREINGPLSPASRCSSCAALTRTLHTEREARAKAEAQRDLAIKALRATEAKLAKLERQLEVEARLG